jgi:hypothetical protein
MGLREAVEGDNREIKITKNNRKNLKSALDLELFSIECRL